MQYVVTGVTGGGSVMFGCRTVWSWAQGVLRVFAGCGLTIAAQAAQTMNVDVQGYTNDTVYAGSNGVLSAGGTYWNNSAYQPLTLKNENQADTSAQLVIFSITAPTNSGAHALYGDGLLAGTATVNVVNFYVRGLDPYKTWDVVLYFRGSRGYAISYDELDVITSTASMTNHQALPGVELGEYLRFRSRRPYEAANGYRLQVSVSAKAGGDDALVGIQLRDTGSRSNIPPRLPALVTPTNAATIRTLTPELTATDFADPDAGDTHAASQWLVDDTADFSSPVWDSGVTSSPATHVQVPAGVLATNKDYYWKVRYKDQLGNWSPYAASARFQTAAPIPPEIDVQGNGISITNNDPAASSADGTDFGSAVVTTGNVRRTFMILNTGIGPLTLTGTPSVVVEGPDAVDFTVTAQPATPVAVGQTGSVEVVFVPVNAGTRTATLSIANDDSDENPYTFAIQGKGELAGLLQFDTTSFPVMENAGSVTVYVARAVGSYGEARVDVFTSNGLASASYDYVAANGTLSWASGDSAPKPFAVRLRDDYGYEGVETFYVWLENATGAAMGFQRFAAVTLIDDDPVNFAPTNIVLSAAVVPENAPTGSTVGVFSTADPDGDTGFVYALTGGAGSSNNAAFSIYGATLLSAASFNYEIQRDYSIRVQSTDQGGLSTQKVFAIAVEDVAEPPPTIHALSGPFNGVAVIRWSSLSNHQYAVYCSTNLQSGFQVVQSNLPATPSMNTYTDATQNLPQRFWRVTTEP
jgi:hypothetical protein